MVAGEGVASLWRGLGLTLWRDVPFSGIYWLGYEAIKERLHKQRERNWHRTAPLNSRAPPKDLHAESTFADSFIGGATSGAVAALITTPFDVGKTRRQIAHGDAARESVPRMLMAIWNAEGWPGLMRGCVPRMLKVAPACAIMVSLCCALFRVCVCVCADLAWVNGKISSYEVGKKAAAGINHRAEMQL